MGPMGLSPMSAATAAATTAVRVRSFLSREEVAALTARLERLPLQPYTSCDEDLDDDSGGVGAGGGDNKRNPAVHVTKYVNTDGIFRGQFRGLRRRVMAVAAAVSARQGWGSTGPSTSTSTSSSGGGGGKVSGSTPRSSKGGARRVRAVPPPWGTCWRRGCGWKPRVCEYHVYGRGGRLTEEGHTDVGSLVTVVGLYKLNPFYP